MSGPDPLARVAAATRARQTATAEWEAAIVDAVLARLPLRQIAAAAGVSHPTVVAIAARHGVEIRGHPPTGYRIVGRSRGIRNRSERSNEMAYRPDIQRQVHESLTDFADEHDIDAIVDEILDRYGSVGIEEVPDEEYWEIVQRHAR